MKTEEKCGICGEAHFIYNCDLIQLKMHIVNKPRPPRARLTLPDELEINTLVDSSFTVSSRYLIERGTQFGPFEAKRLCTLLPSIIFPLKIFLECEDELSEYYLDSIDENECNWMMFIPPATYVEEQNLMCYQNGDEIFYVAIKDIKEGEQLKVWYSPYYAQKMNKELLTVEKIEIEEEDCNTKSVDHLIEQKKNVVAREVWCCKLCGKLENKVSEFASHLLEHYSAKLRKKCEICKQTFLRQQDLQQHIKIIHNSSGVPKIDVSVDIPTKKLSGDKQFLKTKHKDLNVGDPLLLQDSIDHCGLLLPQTELNQLELNDLEHHSNFESENLALNVESLLNDNVKELDPFNFELNDVESDPLICDICLKSFPKLKSLISHMAQHTGKYTCFECNKVFTRKENLDFHSCKAYYKIQCPSCDKLFFQLKSLHHHVKYYHMKKYLCKKCNKNFYSQAILDKHVCFVKVNKKIICTVCSKEFTRKNNLTTHMKLHGDTEKFTCPICNKILKSRSTYSKHQTIHYGPANTCDECGKIFRRLDVLKNHKASVHSKTKVVCEECSKIFSTKKLLQKHMITHQNEKQHKCPICLKQFRVKQNLQRHMKLVHIKRQVNDTKYEGYYSCPKCDVKVKLKQSLIRHVKSNHPGHAYLIQGPTDRFSKIYKNNTQDSFSNSVLDLKQTIENMNFNTDDIQNCSENDINLEIDKLLNNATNMDSLLSESNDRLVESLIDIAINENNVTTLPIQFETKEVCLSMPDLGGGT